MKVLFVDDQLAQNIPRILKVFRAILNPKQISSLEDLEGSENGGTNEQIAKILRRSQSMDVEFTFPAAVKRIMERTRDQRSPYDLYVVDRQLAEEGTEYGVEDITAAGVDYTDADHARFLTREGDFLLKLAVGQGWEVMSRFYFLTAYTPGNDPIKNFPELKCLRDLGFFGGERFVEKGVEDQVRHLADTIAGCEMARKRCEYDDYLRGIACILQEHEVEETICCLSGNGRDIGRVRSIVESTVNTLVRLADVHPDPDPKTRKVTFGSKVRALQEQRCVECSKKAGQPVECKQTGHLSEHNENTRGWLRNVDAAAAKCIFQSCSMFIHNSSEMINKHEAGMILAALKGLLSRITALRDMDLIHAS